MHPLREHKLHFGFLIIPFIMFVIGLYAYRIPEQQTRQGEWVAHTQEVLAQLAFLSLHLTDAETGQRGYLLTGQTVFLDSYSLALQHIDSDMARFQQLTEDNPRQQSQVPLLRGQIAVKLAELKQIIQLNTSLRPEQALKIVFARSGSRQMEVIQRQIAQMQAEQTTLLQQGVAQWKVASAQTRWAFLSAGVLLYTLLGIVFMVARKETKYRKRLMEVEQQATNIQRQATNIQQAEAERLAKVVAIQRDVACTSQDLQATMQTIVERTQAITYAEGCVVAMVADDNLVFRYASGTAALRLGLSLKTASSMAGLCMRENIVLKCDDAETDARVNKAVCKKLGLRSMMGVPLHRGGQTVGVLTVLSSRAAAFTTPDVATMELLGGVLSAALSTAFAMDVLQATEERLEEAQQVAHVGSWELDLVTQEVTWSKEIFRLFGIASKRGEPDIATAMTLFAPESAARARACIQSTMRDGSGFTLDLQQGVTAGGDTPRWYHLVGKPILDDEGKAIRLVGTLLDITESKHHTREMDTKNAELETANVLLQVQATTDGLTGLKNHRAFQERLTEEYQRALRHKIPLSVVMLDVDHFKSFNDTFGHPAGNGVLRSVASLLHATARTSDLVARYGGEEFILLLPETDAVGAVRIAERIRGAIAGATWEERAITVSVGAVTLDTTTESAEHLVDTADKALYQSKTQGRNRVTHTGGVLFLLEDKTLEDSTAVCRVAI